VLAAGKGREQPHVTEQAAAYRVPPLRATDSRVASNDCQLPLVRAVLGPRFAASPAGRSLLQREALWLAFVERALAAMQDVVGWPRLVQVYRAPLRVQRQVPAAAYELFAASRLADVVRRLDLDVCTRHRRRADLRAQFLSTVFHVEVKSHEGRTSYRRRGGARAARALWQAAEAQAAPDTANLLVLGHVQGDVVRGLSEGASPGGPFGAVVWLDLQPRRGCWSAALHVVAGARERFPSALLEVLEHRFAG